LLIFYDGRCYKAVFALAQGTDTPTPTGGEYSYPGEDAPSDEADPLSLGVSPQKKRKGIPQITIKPPQPTKATPFVTLVPPVVTVPPKCPQCDDYSFCCNQECVKGSLKTHICCETNDSPYSCMKGEENCCGFGCCDVGHDCCGIGPDQVCCPDKTHCVNNKCVSVY